MSEDSSSSKQSDDYPSSKQSDDYPSSKEESEADFPSSSKQSEDSSSKQKTVKTLKTSVVESHRNNLAKLCRLCALKLTIHGYSHDVKKHSSKIQHAFSINTDDDDILIHPTHICNRCYSSLLNFQKRGKRPAIEEHSWSPHVNSDCITCLRVDVKGKGGRPVKYKNAGRAPAKKSESSSSSCSKKVYTVEDIMKLDDSQPIPNEIEKSLAHVMAIKLKQSSLPNRTIQIKTAGPQPLTLTPIVAPLKGSDNVSKRTLHSRTQQSKDIIKLLSGNTEEALHKQTAVIVNSFDKTSREEIIKNLDIAVQIPAEHAAAMKSNLNIPWNVMRNIRRWLNSFKVKLASEGKTREVASEWIGKGLVSELAPLLVTKAKKNVIESRAWCYLFNLVGHVLQRLNDLQQCSMLVDHPFIPKDEVHLKIGGDHGGKSFKMSYQIANVVNPNKASNCVIFSIFEAKDKLPNLRICLERFKGHIEKLKTVLWVDGLGLERKFKIFMFGDYAFLCAMYGLSGANGVHPCLWCQISSVSMQTEKALRMPAKRRTLETLKENFDAFCIRGRKLKFAKHHFNVIENCFFNIPIENAWIPGLHITLGVYLKMFNMLELYCADVDIKVADIYAGRGIVSEADFGEYVVKLRTLKLVESELLEMEEEQTTLQDELDWFSISQEEIDVDGYEDVLRDLNVKMKEKADVVEKLNKEIKDANVVGPCVSSLDRILKTIGVQRQAYHSNSFVGNDCHTLLKDKNIEILCNSILEIIQNIDNDLFNESEEQISKFKALFSKYAQCHVIFNSSCFLEEAEIDFLDNAISDFMSYLRCNWDVRISPKLHMLEDHMVEFIRRWGVGCGFYGEQGGESLHNAINKLQRYDTIKCDVDRLKYTMNQHLLSTNPKAKIIEPPKKQRKFKQKEPTV